MVPSWLFVNIQCMFMHDVLTWYFVESVLYTNKERQPRCNPGVGGHYREGDLWERVGLELGLVGVGVVVG